MEKFKFLEHTSDVYIESYGNTLEEAFENCAYGLMKLMIDNYEKIKRKIERKISVSGEDLESLLFEFLTQFLIFHDSENLVFSYVKVNKIFKNEKWNLEAVVEGDEFDPEKYQGGVAVKAITYHDMRIEKNGKFKIKVLVDI